MKRISRKKLREEWIEALESGKFKKGKWEMKIIPRSPKAKPRYCCLGVLAEIAKVPFSPGCYDTASEAMMMGASDLSSSEELENLMIKVGLVDHEGCPARGRTDRSLVSLNDGGGGCTGFSFKKIAKKLRSGDYWIENKPHD